MKNNQLDDNHSDPMRKSNVAIQHFQSRFYRLKGENNNLEPEFYFVTVVFNKAKTPPVQYSNERPLYNDIQPESLWRWFDKLYVKVNTLALGRNFHRISKRPLQPMAYGYIDVASSKIKNHIGVGDFGAYKDPHIHSIMMTEMPLD